MKKSRNVENSTVHKHNLRVRTIYGNYSTNPFKGFSYRSTSVSERASAPLPSLRSVPGMMASDYGPGLSESSAPLREILHIDIFVR